jgi:hypothetical protein
VPPSAQRLLAYEQEWRTERARALSFELQGRRIQAAASPAGGGRGTVLVGASARIRIPRAAEMGRA